MGLTIHETWATGVLTRALKDNGDGTGTLTFYDPVTGSIIGTPTTVTGDPKLVTESDNSVGERFDFRAHSGWSSSDKAFIVDQSHVSINGIQGYIAWLLPLAEGTWTLEVTATEANEGGKIAVTVGGQAVGQFDTQGDGGPGTIYRLEEFTIAGNGPHELRLTLTTILSRPLLSSITLVRTA